MFFGTTYTFSKQYSNSFVLYNSSPISYVNLILPFVLESIYTDQDFVIIEALFIILGFSDKQNSEIIIDNYNLDFIKNLFNCLKNVYSKCKSGVPFANMEVLERTVNCLNNFFEIGNLFKSNNSTNKFVLDFEKNGGFELLEMMLNGNNFSPMVAQDAEYLLQYRKKNN